MCIWALRSFSQHSEVSVPDPNEPGVNKKTHKIGRHGSVSERQWAGYKETPTATGMGCCHGCNTSFSFLIYILHLPLHQYVCSLFRSGRVPNSTSRSDFTFQGSALLHVHRQVPPGQRQLQLPWPHPARTGVLAQKRRQPPVASCVFWWGCERGVQLESRWGTDMSKFLHEWL